MRAANVNRASAMAGGLRRCAQTLGALSVAIPVAALVGFTPIASSTANAADRAPFEQRVSYAGLDLGKPGDLATFKRRLTAAAEKVCRPESESVALRTRRIGERCMADAIVRALERLDDRTLSAKLLAAASGRKNLP